MARILVDCPRYTEAHRICHLDGVISDILSDNPCPALNILAFITAIGLATVI
jgi:hypothetical protein